MKSFEEYTGAQVQLVCAGMLLNNRWKIAEVPNDIPDRGCTDLSFKIIGIELPGTNPSILNGNIEQSAFWSLNPNHPPKDNILPLQNRQLLEEALDRYYNPIVLRKPRLDCID